MNESNSVSLLSQYTGLHKEHEELYHETARYYGLSDCAMWILSVIWESNTPYTQSEICEKLFQSRQTIHSALKKLTEAGFLELKFAYDNRKSKQIFLTEQGTAFAKKSVDRVIRAEQNAFSILSEQEQNTFVTLFHKYVQQLKTEMDAIQKNDSLEPGG